MKLLTEESQREAVNMRVIAFVTFLLLPATFASVSASQRLEEGPHTDSEQTFFSTDVVKYQSSTDSNGTFDETYSPLAMQRWFEITLPLTLFTFIIAGLMLSQKQVKHTVEWLFRDILCQRHVRMRLTDDEGKPE
jgi:hypothetical protein